MRPCGRRSPVRSAARLQLARLQSSCSLQRMRCNWHARERSVHSAARLRLARSQSSFELSRVRAAPSKGSLRPQPARSQTSCGQQRLRTALSKGSPRLHLACDRAAGPGCLEGPPVEATLQHARTVLAVLGARRASYATGGARGPHSAFY